MFKAKNSFFILLALVLYISSQAQNYVDKTYYLIDSLEYDNLIESEKKILDSSLTIYHKTASDTQKLKAVNFIIENSWDEKVWPRYNQWMYQYTSDKLNGLVEGFNEDDISLVEKELLIYYGNSINNKGYLLAEFGDIKGSLAYYYKALTIREQLKDSLGLSESYNNLGSIYASQENYKKALVYMDKTLGILGRIGNRAAVATTLINEGVVYEKLGNTEKALDCFKRGLAMSKELNDKVGVVNALNNLGAFYLHDKKFEKSLMCLNESEKISEGLGYQQGYIQSLIKQAEIHLYNNKIVKAKLKAAKAYDAAKASSSPENIVITAKVLSVILQKEGDWKKAFVVQEGYFKMRDSVENSEIEKNIIQQKATYDLNKKQKEIELLSAKNEIQELKLTKNRNSIILISIALFLTLITAFVSFRGYKKKQYINKLLERQKAEISRKNESKKTMLQEIHHRVKNNLQVVNSLLRMQSSKLEDENIVDMFKETQSRVRSMAKLHEKMYQSGDLEKLNSKEHITMLVEGIVKNYSVDTTINLDLDIDAIFIDAQTMMPLSLIINEMITNSLKYAFEGREEGLITVKFNKVSDTNELIISDDGVGYIPEKTVKGLGSRLISSFTRQLDGSIEKIVDSGTTYKLVFSNI